MLSPDHPRKPCKYCGHPTGWRDEDVPVCPLCASYALKGGLVDCKQCHRPLVPIGETSRGIQMFSCPSCGDVRAEVKGVVLTRGGQTESHRSHKPEKAGSTPAPATKIKKARKEDGSQSKRSTSSGSKGQGNAGKSALVPKRVPAGVAGTGKTDRKHVSIRHNASSKIVQQRRAAAGDSRRRVPKSSVNTARGSGKRKS